MQKKSSEANITVENTIKFQQALSFHQQGQLESAEILYKEVLQIQPQHDDALHFLGVIAFQRGQHQHAIDLISQSININPNNAGSYLNIALAFQALNCFEEVLASYDRALTIKPDHVETLFNRGNVLIELKRYDEALASYDHALTINSDHVDALFNRGSVLNELKRYGEALASYDRALTIKPDHVDALFNRGSVLNELKRYHECLASYDRAVNIKPDYTEVFSNRGIVLTTLKRYEEAIASYNHALTIKPNYVEAISNLGNVLTELKHYDKAIASYDRALTINPDHVETLFNRGNVLNEFKRYDEAIASYDRALTIKPDMEFLFDDWFHTKLKICDWNGVDNNLNKLEQGIERDGKISRPFIIQIASSSAALQKKAACCYAQEKHPTNVLAPPIVKHVHAKIKIGYFSADFCNHAVAILTAELFERHDRSRFEVIAFSFHTANHKDNMRLRLEGVFDQFIDVSQQSDEQVVRLARQLEIDIAVDLNGFTGGSRPNLFAMRLAPIQVSYLGYIGTMGTYYIDYLLADTTLIPIEHQAHYCEKIAYLPHSFQVNDSKLPIANKSFTRAELGLPEQGFVFCCFNNNYKITPAVFDSWMRILHQVEGSVLWLLEDNDTAAKNLRLAATARGIDAKRICFAKRLPKPEHLARHRLADLFLDTQPCNAGATASDSLWAGLPILTCLGETFAGRMAASLLYAIGLPELVTKNVTDYEALAIQLATHSEQLTVLKQKLADNRLTYPLFNTALFTQHIESAYQMMFERYQADLAPEHIYIPAQEVTATLQQQPLPSADIKAVEKQVKPSHSLSVFGKIAQLFVGTTAFSKRKNKSVTSIPTQADSKFQQAQQFHQQGRLEVAVILYEELLETQPDHTEALRCLNAIKKQRKQPRIKVNLPKKEVDKVQVQLTTTLEKQEANQLVLLVTNADTDAVEALINQGNEQEDSGEFHEALATYNRALSINPDSARAHSNRGNALQILNRLDEALASYDRALTIRPDYAEAFYNRGNTLQACSRFQEAIVSYDRALVIKPDFVQAHIGRGNALHECKRFSDALLSYDYALAIQPNHAEVLYNRGNVLQDLKRHDEAIASYNRALTIKPDCAEAFFNYGNVLAQLKRYNDALASYDRALSIDPDYAEALSNRGNTLKELKRYDEALASYNRAVNIRPNYAEFHYSRGIVLSDLKRYDEALASYNRALSIKPDYASAHWNIGLCQLLLGDFANGWRNYEGRRQSDALRENYYNTFKQPLWLGEQSLLGKTILLYAEQGFGDTLQFCRYAKQVKALGAIVLLEIQPALSTLLHSLQGVDVLLNKGDPLPNFDYHCPLMSLPLAFNTALATIPADTAYLFSQTERMKKWQAKLGDKTSLRVGLVWSGSTIHTNDHNRSIALSQLSQLLNNAAHFFSLQKEVRTDDATILAGFTNIQHFGDQLQDFADTACLCELMDVIISVDTSVAHLAAAIGKPTWILLPYNPEWRWLLDRDDSPWYPTVRLFRQNQHSDWQDVIDQLQLELRYLLEPIPTINSTVIIDEDAIEALINQGNELEDLGEVDEALTTYNRALSINPDSARAHSNRGNVLQILNRLDEALASYDRALTIRPDYAEAFYNRGNTLQACSRFQEAIVSYDRALVIKPDFVQAHIGRGNALHECKRFSDALLSYDYALAIQPNHAEVLYNRGNVLQDLKRYDEALVSYDRAVNIKPDYIEALFNCGNMLAKLKRYDDALVSYDRVLAVEPNYAEALANRGNTLKELKRYDEALASYDDVLKITPDNAGVLSNRGSVLKDLNRYDEALNSYDRALAIKTDYAEALFNRGNVLNELKRYDETIVSYGRALTIKPDYEFLLGDWLHIKMKICDWTEFDKNLNKLEQGIERGEKVSGPFSVLTLSSSAALQKKAACCYAQEKYPTDVLLPSPRKYTHPKIKIGYFSSDFCQHPVAYLTAELFERQDRSRFEIIAFSFLAASDKDDMRLRLEGVFDQFIDVSQQSDEQVVQLARQLEIDIAVDLNGFTTGCRTRLFAMRVAPIQVSYLGYLGTMGTNYIDYLLADTTLIPVEHQAHYSEKIAYLPHSFQVNDSKLPIANKSFTRAELGLPEQGFVFCCFNNNYKITPAVFDSWMRILHQVEGSVLWLLEDNSTVANNLRRAAIAHGIAGERLVFAQRLPMPEYLARHRVADLFLDTSPYNAGATASAALWAGLPILTYLGDTFSGRMAASLLYAIGLPELVTKNVTDYEALAIQLATHSEQLTVLKQKLADNRLTYPLFNTALFTQHIESAYQMMFDRYQADLTPEHIYIT